MLPTSLLLFFLIAHGSAVNKATDIQTGMYNPAVDTSFCNVKCGRNKAGINAERRELHVACHCHSSSMKSCSRFNEDAIPDLRLAMTIAHNSIRNNVALGYYSHDFNLPQASDMNAVSYDLALEYSASCSANKCQTGVDLCIRIAGHDYVAQNNVVLEIPTSENLLNLSSKAVEYWLETAIFLPPNVVNKYEEGEWEAGTAMLWSSVKSIGCAFNELGNEIMDKREMTETTEKTKQILIVCNYGSSRDINDVGGRVYRKGQPATQCDERGGSSVDYPGLCGRISQVPIAQMRRGGGEPLIEISASGKYGSPTLSELNRAKENTLLFSLVLLLLLLALHI